LGRNERAYATPCRTQPRRSSSPSTTSASTRSQPSIFRPRISKRHTCGSLISDSPQPARRAAGRLTAGTDGHVALDEEGARRTCAGPSRSDALGFGTRARSTGAAFDSAGPTDPRQSRTFCWWGWPSRWDTSGSPYVDGPCMGTSPTAPAERPGTFRVRDLGSDPNPTESRM
jgi:hypothetical protein